MTTYSQRTPNDCGPAAMAWALSNFAVITFDEAYALLQKNWPSQRMFDQKEQPLDNLTDSPGEHESIAERLKIPFRLATLGELQAGKLPAQRTIMLAHPWHEVPTRQHWVVLQSYSSEGFTNWHWGNGKIVTVSPEKLIRWYSDWTPACIYVLGETGKKLPWYARAFAWVANLFA